MHDVLILGAGLAGQRAALAAAETGASVVLVSKVHPVRSHSVAAAGGINASVGKGDTWEAHAQDTTKGPDYLGDQDAIEVMCREAPGEIAHTERLGVPFHRNEHGRLATRPFGAASQQRGAADMHGPVATWVGHRGRRLPKAFLGRSQLRWPCDYRDRDAAGTAALRASEQLRDRRVVQERSTRRTWRLGHTRDDDPPALRLRRDAPAAPRDTNRPDETLTTAHPNAHSQQDWHLLQAPRLRAYCKIEVSMKVAVPAPSTRRRWGRPPPDGPCAATPHAPCPTTRGRSGRPAAGP